MIFEILMLTCFGFAWPISIYKSVTSKSIQGKSVLFLYVIIVGYISGIIYKIYYNMDFVVYLYGLNALMVFVDLLLFYRNKKNLKNNLN